VSNQVSRSMYSTTRPDKWDVVAAAYEGGATEPVHCVSMASGVVEPVTQDRLLKNLFLTVT